MNIVDKLIEYRNTRNADIFGSIESDNDLMGTIKRSIQQREYVLLFPYTDRFGLKKLIACYDELKINGIEAEVYELDDELTTIEFMKNLNDTYDEISDEIDAEE